MNLADALDSGGGGGAFLQTGWHKVRVTDFRLFKFNSGTEGVEFHVETAEEKKGKVSFTLMYDNEGCMYRLAEFATACGLTRADCGNYEPKSAASHAVLLRKSVQVYSEPKKDSKYHEITAWRAIDAKELPNTPPATASPAPLPPVAADVPAGPSNDDIPF